MAMREGGGDMADDEEGVCPLRRSSYSENEEEHSKMKINKECERTLYAHPL